MSYRLDTLDVCAALLRSCTSRFYFGVRVNRLGHSHWMHETPICTVTRSHMDIMPAFHYVLMSICVEYVTDMKIIHTTGQS